jgi:hypothetical protein
MTTTIPTQPHPATNWPAEQQRRFEQWNFCPCGTRIAWAAPHCGEDECRDLHNTAEHLLDLMGDLDA